MDEQMKACRQENGACDAITAQPQGVYNVANLNKFVSLKGEDCSDLHIVY